MKPAKITCATHVKRNEVRDIWTNHVADKVKSFLVDRGYSHPVENRNPPTPEGIIPEYSFESKFDQWKTTWRRFVGSMSDAEIQAIRFLQNPAADLSALRAQIDLVEDIPEELMLTKRAQVYLQGIAVDSDTGMVTRPGIEPPKNRPIYPYDDLHFLYPLKWDGYEQFRAAGFYRITHNLAPSPERTAVQCVAGSYHDRSHKHDWPELNETHLRHVEMIHLARQRMEKNTGADSE